MQSIKQAIKKAIRCVKKHANKKKASINIIQLDGKMFDITPHKPDLIIPWNFPLNMLAWKLGPGQFVNILNGCGSDAGTLNPDAAKMAFTGNSAVDHKIAELLAEGYPMKATGDKSPIIVLPGADLDQTAMAAYLAGSKVFVHEDIYDRFVAKMVELAKNWNTRDPTKFQTQLVPSVEKIQFGNVLDNIQKGKSEDAKLEFGSFQALDKHYFIQPTTFTFVEDGKSIAKEDIFRPMMSILKFKDLGDALKHANATNYGLGAGICMSPWGWHSVGQHFQPL